MFILNADPMRTGILIGKLASGFMPTFANRAIPGLLAIVMSGCFDGEAPGAPSGDPSANSTVASITLESGYHSTVADWDAFLSCWARELRAQDARLGSELQGMWADARDAASREADNIERALSGAESRLGRRLPASFRHFIQASGGRFLLGIDRSRDRSLISDFVQPEDLQLFRVAEPDAYDMWREAGSTFVPDREYFRYGVDSDGRPRHDPVNFRPQYLDSAILVGKWPSEGYLLIVPGVEFGDGEWEAWLLSWRTPGATRFRSYAELMQNIAVAVTADPPHGEPFSRDLIVSTCANLLKTAANSQ